MAEALRRSIRQGTIWRLHDTESLRLVASAFLPELQRLTHASRAIEQRVNGLASHVQNRRSPSNLIFDKDFDEINRTLTGFLALKWLISDDYATFTGGQDHKTKLSLSSFRRLRKLYLATLSDHDDSFTLINALVINDLGKDKTLATALEAKTGRPHTMENHDVVLYEAVQAGIFPCMQNLGRQQRDDVLLGLETGARLNMAQLAQAENVPGSLDVILKLKGHEHAFELKFFEQVLDVAGAAGHIDSTCAKSFVEPVYQAFMTSHKVLTDILHGRCTLREGYDDVLTQRASTLYEKGYRRLDVRDSQERALLRLMTMGRTTDHEQAEWFERAFQSLKPRTRENLIMGLNVDGYKDGKAIIPYYMPALLQAGLHNTADDSAQSKVDALASLMRFLTRILDGTSPSPGRPGEVIEHDLLFAKETVAGRGFRDDPGILDKLDVTKS